ncbi:MAG: NAD(P)-dependent oxidoreductase [Eubacterium sp.]|nr:NAD(P)-dependent oxidoreductase [Eubacterium sp.]
MRAVVTGANGAVGWGLVYALVNQGFDVTVLCRKEPELYGIDKTNIEFVSCSLENYCNLNLNCKADYFFHLAWNGTYGSERNDKKAQYANVGYTLDAVRLAQKTGCKKFVAVGSQAEYGVLPYGVKISEKLKENPVTYYAKAKVKAHKEAMALCSELGIGFNWCRILSTYGIGDRDYTLTMYAIDGFINGKSCNFTPCEQTWDYINNEDLGRALCLVCEKGKNNEDYVIASGQEKALKDYIKMIYNAVGNNGAKMNFGARDYFENQVMYLCADISKLKEDTSFEAQITFEEGIKRTVSWRKKYISEM